MQDIDENYDEDPNAIDEENEGNNIDDEYVEMDSIDEKMIKMHHKYVADFIIRNDNQNEEEILKIQKYMQYNPNMLISDNKAKVENSNNEINEEINLNIDENNIEENKENENNDKNNEEGGDETKNKENNPEPVKNGIEIYKQDIDIEKAFEKHDRIVRTPPGEYK